MEPPWRSKYQLEPRIAKLCMTPSQPPGRSRCDDRGRESDPIRPRRLDRGCDHGNVAPGVGSAAGPNAARNGVPVNGWPQSSWDETETLDCAIDAAKYGTGLRGPRQRTDDSELGAPRVCHRPPVPGKVALPKVADPNYATGAQMTAVSRGIASSPGGPWVRD